LFEITLAFVRLDHLARRIVKRESQPDVRGCGASLKGQSKIWMNNHKKR